MEENSSVKKRLILTTVHNNQLSVQIDLFRSAASTMADAQYIGSVVVENINPRSKGDPSIEMVISSNADGDITADAIDLDTGPDGEHHILSVSLKSLDETGQEADIPDFELETSVEPPSGLYNQAKKIRQKESGSFPWLIVIIIGVVIILALAVLWFFLFGGKDRLSFRGGKTSTEQSAPMPSEEPPPLAQQSAPPEPVQPPAPPQEVQPPAPPPQQAQPEPPPVIQAPAAPPPVRTEPVVRRRPPAPVASYNVPAVIPREGVPYTIRWGDTLWDIAEAFYRNPWLYPRIAQHNNIRNPNLIISGRTIRIPPKN
jgi:LysM repeat protein